MKKELRKCTANQVASTLFEVLAGCKCISHCMPDDQYPQAGKYKETQNVTKGLG